jgi:hypothetical protein
MVHDTEQGGQELGYWFDTYTKLHGITLQKNIIIQEDFDSV